MDEAAGRVGVLPNVCGQVPWTKRDSITPVSDQYKSPFPFTGTIRRILVDISDAEFQDLVAMAIVAMVAMAIQ